MCPLAVLVGDRRARRTLHRKVLGDSFSHRADLGEKLRRSFTFLGFARALPKMLRTARKLWPTMFQLWFNYGSTMFELCFNYGFATTRFSNYVPTMFQLCFNDGSTMFQLCFNYTSTMDLQKHAPNVPNYVSTMFQVCVNYISTMFQLWFNYGSTMSFTKPF